MMEPLFDPEKVRAAQEAHAAFRRRWRFEGLPPYGSDVHWAFLQAVDAAWPPELQTLPTYDAKGLDLALRFLEEDPFFFRSGYAKAEVLRRLPRWPLDVQARARIAHIVLRSVDGPPYREFRWVAKAARHADRAALLPGLLARLDLSGTVAWQAFCAAHCLLGDGFPTWERCHAEPGPQIDAMRRRLGDQDPK